MLAHELNIDFVLAGKTSTHRSIFGGKSVIFLIYMIELYCLCEKSFEAFC